jgi:SHS2 domain-containing protein
VWTHFHHEADIGVQGTGGTVAQAFEEAALAMTAVITDPETVVCRQTVEVDCEAPDRELLLVDWLNALIYEMATRGMLFRRFSVEFDGSRLHGSACGEGVDVARHTPAVEIKGATYTGLEVREDPSGVWRARCVVDV